MAKAHKCGRREKFINIDFAALVARCGRDCGTQLNRDDPELMNELGDPNKLPPEKPVYDYAFIKLVYHLSTLATDNDVLRDDEQKAIAKLLSEVGKVFLRPDRRRLLVSGKGGPIDDDTDELEEMIERVKLIAKKKNNKRMQKALDRLSAAVEENKLMQLRELGEVYQAFGKDLRLGESEVRTLAKELHKEGIVGEKEVEPVIENVTADKKRGTFTVFAELISPFIIIQQDGKIKTVDHLRGKARPRPGGVLLCQVKPGEQKEERPDTEEDDEEESEEETSTDQSAKTKTEKAKSVKETEKAKSVKKEKKKKKTKKKTEKKESKPEVKVEKKPEPKVVETKVEQKAEAKAKAKSKKKKKKQKKEKKKKSVDEKRTSSPAPPPQAQKVEQVQKIEQVQKVEKRPSQETKVAEKQTVQNPPPTSYAVVTEQRRTSAPPPPPPPPPPSPQTAEARQARLSRLCLIFNQYFVPEEKKLPLQRLSAQHVQFEPSLTITVMNDRIIQVLSLLYEIENRGRPLTEMEIDFVRNVVEDNCMIPIENVRVMMQGIIDANYISKEAAEVALQDLTKGRPDPRIVSVYSAKWFIHNLVKKQATAQHVQSTAPAQ